MTNGKPQQNEDARTPEQDAGQESARVRNLDVSEIAVRSAKLDLPDPSQDPEAARVGKLREQLAQHVPRVMAGDAQGQDADQAEDGQAEETPASSAAPADESGEESADGASEGGAAEDGSAEGGAAPDGEAADASSATDQPSRDRTSFRKVFLGLLAVALVLAVGVASWFAWDRWGRYDDHADMQGDWYVRGTAVLVPIDDSTIKLADDVVYKYAINDHDKTISYTFGDWKGSGRYWFSDDRSILIITDGNTFTGTSNTIDDLVRLFNETMARGNGQTVELPDGDGIIVFSRSPDPQAYIAKVIKETKEKNAAETAEEQDEDYWDDEEYYYE